MWTLGEVRAHVGRGGDHRRAGLGSPTQHRQCRVEVWGAIVNARQDVGVKINQPAHLSIVSCDPAGASALSSAPDRRRAERSQAMRQTPLALATEVLTQTGSARIA